MKPTILTFLICLFGLNHVTTCNAQKDPFGQTTSTKKDVTASPSELSDFKDYRTNPENATVSSLLAKELGLVLKAEDKKQITLIDARSKKEYDVSHINNSKRIGYEDFSIQRIWMVPRDAQIVIYSTNKARSTTVAQYLKLIGFSAVQVLEDGLIGWKNGKNVVYDANGTTNKIHVRTKDNAKLVKSGLAVY
jgi:rhodanese-related sulfurtransferase